MSVAAIIKRLPLSTVLSAVNAREDDEWEFKAAKGGFPNSIWDTYSAMANEAGGTIVLGASEREEQVIFDGLSTDQINKYKKALWDSLNDRGVVNRNLLRSESVREICCNNGAWLLIIDIPQALRNEKPIYRGQDPFRGTFKRRHEGDYRCSEEEVRRMFADADLARPPDTRILDGFSLEDLDADSISGFRNRFATTNPDHPWLADSNDELLKKLGAWRKDRESKKEGLTIAGLLMFGKHSSLIDPSAVPNYLVDFRDYRGRTSASDRWTDRLTPDGTWESNLFQFYIRVWPKLTADLKVPFQLQGEQRIDETPVHHALREALVNALIHTDYSVGGGIVIERHPERYSIENPGTLLVSQEQLRRGGVSECRNKALQGMFFCLGRGDKAGSGFARIQMGWKSVHWRVPRLTTQEEPDRIKLDMPMVSLIPADALEALQKLFGDSLNTLTHDERLAVATAHIEGDVTNTRMRDLTQSHPSDIGKMLRGLVEKGLLQGENQRRWTRYNLRGEHDNLSLFRQASLHLGHDSSLLMPKSEERPHKNEELKKMAAAIANKGKVSKETMRLGILAICESRFLTLTDLSELLNRERVSLRNNHLTPLVGEGLLQLRFPNSPNHPNQAYTATAKESDG